MTLNKTDYFRELYSALWLNSEQYQRMVNANRSALYAAWMNKQWLNESDFAPLVPDPNMQLPEGF